MTEREEQELLAKSRIAYLKEELQKRVCDWANENNIRVFIYVEVPIQTSNESGFVYTLWTPDFLGAVDSIYLERNVAKTLVDRFIP